MKNGEHFQLKWGGRNLDLETEEKSFQVNADPRTEISKQGRNTYSSEGVPALYLSYFFLFKLSCV